MTFLKYRRKSIYTRAEQQTQDFTILTEHGEVKGKAGDYIALDELDQKYPISKEVFDATYKERQ